MSLRRRLMVLTTTVILSLLAGSLTALWLSAGRNREATTAVRLRTAAAASSRLSIAMLDQETGQRGFLITGDDTYLTPYVVGQEAFTTALADVRRLAEPAFTTDIEQVADAASAWQRQAGDREIAMRRASGLAAAADTMAVDGGKAQFDIYRSSQARLDQRLTEAADAARAHVNQLSSWTSITLAVLVVVTAIAVLGAAVMIRRWVLRPIEEVAIAARHVRAGALDHAIVSQGPPEIAMLASDIEGMRRTLRRYLDDSERSRRALEQNAALVLALRSEATPALDLPDGWSSAGLIRSAEGLIAGDTFDLVRFGPHTIGAVVLDIAGHGALEGLLALRCREQLRAALAAGAQPSDALRIVAAQLGRTDDDLFLTAFAAVIDLRDGSCRYANAGHPPAFLVTPDGTIALEPTGPLIGPIDGSWRTLDATIPVGGHVVIYTDGLTEARRADGEFFGEDRLEQLASTLGHGPARELLRRYLRSYVEFGVPVQRDDVTVLVIARQDVLVPAGARRTTL